MHLQTTLRHPLTLQIVRFILIGTLAAAVNFIIVWLLVETIALKPLFANVFAFCGAFFVSVTGHQHYTFAHHDQKHSQKQRNAWRFFNVALLSLCLNELFYALFLHLHPTDYLVDLLLTLLIVPCFTFILAKYWAFRG